jgi:hypothetical protein
MAPQRTFDYELLKQLVREHGDWSYREYAQTLTLDMRNKTGDPKYPAVMPNAVAAVISRNRDRWADDGLVVDDQRMPVYRELIPARWKLPERHQMDTHIRKLRTLARLRRGLGATEKDARQALQFERTLRDRKQVVDVTPAGRPVLRPAAPWELDDTGELIEIVAQPEPPGYSRRLQVVQGL